MTTLLEHEDEDPRAGLRRGWVRVPGTCLYVGPLLGLLLVMLYVVSWVGTDLVYLLAALLRDAPLRRASVLDGLTGAALYLALIAVHEGTHALTASALGGRVVRVGLGGGGAHVRYSGLDHRPGADALVMVTGPVVHLTVAAGLVLLTAGSDWSRTAHAAVLTAAALNVVEATVNLVPWRGPRRRSDGWNALTGARRARPGIDRPTPCPRA
jgi:hypothetical protein